MFMVQLKKEHFFFAVDYIKVMDLPLRYPAGRILKSVTVILKI